MKSETMDLTTVVEALEGLRQELSRLGERVTALESVRASAAPAAALSEDRPTVKARETAPPPAKPGAANELNEELVLIISAAIAAFLGKRPHVRQIRLIGSAAWAQEGRATIQASHEHQFIRRGVSLET